MTKRLNVLFIAAWYPAASNPVEGIFIREHALSVNLYDDVRVVHLSNPSRKGRLWDFREEIDPQLSEGILTYHLTSRRLPVPGLSYLIFLWGILRAFRKLRKEGFTPDIIHAHIYSAGVAAVILGKIYHVPVVVTEHNSAFQRKDLSPINIYKARFAFQNAQCVTVVSQSLKKNIEQYHIKSNFMVIPNAVDLTQFYYDQSKTIHDPPKIIFVGSLIPRKGLDFLLPALERIKDRPWKLDIIGDGPSKFKYEELSKSLNLNSRIRFLGYQAHASVSEFMRQADLIVSSSLSENQPCVLLEAQACGLPIIGTNVGGIPEIIYPGSGWLAQPGDIASLANALSIALEQILIIDRKEISNIAKKYSLSNVGLNFHNLYEELLKW